MSRQSAHGFTLLEIVLVIALISLIAGFGFRLQHLLAPQEARHSDQFAVVTALFRAQTLAASGRTGGPWGVRVVDATVTVFAGDSYADRDVSFDEEVPLEAGGDVQSTGDVVFSALNGFPDGPATVSFAYDDGIGFVTINDYGAITYTSEE